MEGRIKPTFVRRPFDRHCFNESNSIDVAPTIPKRMKKDGGGQTDFEHAHHHFQLDCNSSERYECMDCMASFENGDQLLQHLDTHDTTSPSETEESKVECPICSCRFDKVSGSKEQADKSLECHIILEHFKATIPQSVLEDSYGGIRIKSGEFEMAEDALPSDATGVFKCSVCPRSFDQLYQRRIHEKYAHQESSLREFSHLQKLVKCPSCKTLCKDQHQYLLHKQLYCDVGFECKQCSERFSRISLLATHMRVKHGAVTAPKSREIFIPVAGGLEDIVAASSNTQHRCILCGLNKTNGEELMAHYNARHAFDVTSLKPIQCDKCTLKAVEIKPFIEHYKKQHMK